jgi:PIN domain nuclease of toxin-antitoxin system
MRILLDTHALIWFVDQHQLLSPPAHSAITDPANQVLVSAASIWEIAVKVALGKLSLSLPYKQWANSALNHLGATVLQITVDYTEPLTTLPTHHRDPFDRLLIAQAVVEQIPIVSKDAAFDAYSVRRLW